MAVAQHLLASALAQLPPLPVQLGDGQVGSPRGGCVLELLDSWLRPSEQSRRSREVSVSVWTQGLQGTNRPGCLGVAAGQASPWRGLGWQAPLEAGQPHLVGIGFDTCFQTRLQPLNLPWAGVASPVDTVCKGSESARGRAWKGATHLAWETALSSAGPAAPGSPEHLRHFPMRRPGRGPAAQSGSLRQR